MSRLSAVLERLRGGSAGAPLPLGTKLGWISVLYFASGFPFGIAYDVWPYYFREHGVSLRDIGLMALLFLPYTLKAAWAPFVDRWGSRQSWIVSCLLTLAVALFVFSRLDPRLLAGGQESSGYWVMWAVLLTVMLLSATQDISVDAYAVDIARPEETGHVNGVRTAAYRAALLFASGVLLVIADRPALGWGVAWGISIVLCLLLALGVFASPRVPRERAGAAHSTQGARVLSSARLTAFRVAASVATIALLFWAWRVGWSGLPTTLAALAAAAALASFLSPELLGWLLRPEMLPVVAFALFFKLGDSMLGRMVKPFWVDVGMTKTEIATVSNGLGMALTIAGALLGGWFIARRGIFQGLLWMGLGQVISNFGYVAVAALDLPHGDASLWNLSFGPFQAALYGASMFESVTQGLGTAAFMSFLMNQCDRAHAATQYAMLTAAYSLTRDLAGAFSGIGAEAWGYPAYFAFTACLALPGIALLPLVRKRIREREPPAGQPAEA